MLFVLFAPYQTLVQTVITDDAVRKGVEADDYDMTWVQVANGVGVLYGLFMALWLSAPIGARYTIALGLLGFALGNLLCGAAGGLVRLAVGRFIEGFGKMVVMGLGRTTLYKQFDRVLLVAIGFYGIFAYATRNSTPLLMAALDVGLSWRWIYWVYVPVALVGLGLVWRYFRPDRPPRPMHLPIDWLAVTLFVAWVVAITFAFSWYRKWGGWTSNAFAGTVILCVVLPVVLVVWLGSGYSPEEHLKRLLRTRVFILAMTTRGLMLLNLVAVLTIVGMYATELRGYPGSQQAG
jgi:MFS family permease